MKSILLVVLLLLAPALYADDASKKAKVEELIQLTQLEKNYSQMIYLMMDSMSLAVRQQLSQVKMTPAREAMLTEFQKDVTELFREQFGWDYMLGVYTKLYNEEFTEEEIDGMVAFYRSPAGKSVIEKTPIVMSKATAIGQERGQSLQPAIAELMQDFMARYMQDIPLP